jgi:hypothetical protein
VGLSGGATSATEGAGACAGAAGTRSVAPAGAFAGAASASTLGVGLAPALGRAAGRTASARWPQVARWKPAAPSPRPARSSIPRAGYAPERARRAVPALRSADRATESRSPEAQVPGHRRSGPAATSETAGRAAAQEQAACLPDGRVVSAVDRDRRPEEIAPAPVTIAVCARPRNVRCSSKLRHRFQDAAADRGQVARRPHP